jgi:hypothetical protein
VSAYLDNLVILSVNKNLSAYSSFDIVIASIIAGTLSNNPDNRIAVMTLSKTLFVTEQSELMDGFVIDEPNIL